MRRFWRQGAGAGLGRRRSPLIGVLMWGGVLGLPYVEQRALGRAAADADPRDLRHRASPFRSAILLALGRRSELPAITALCVGYIELIRGVPLITRAVHGLGHAAAVPARRASTIDKLLRAQIAIILFAAAYLAEVVRGGLQAIPKGQYEAADALGLGYWQKTGLIILPQALRAGDPAAGQHLHRLFKDTSLVLIIGLFDLLGIAKASIVDAGLAAASTSRATSSSALVYFVFCFAMSRYSQCLERELAHRPRKH